MTNGTVAMRLEMAKTAEPYVHQAGFSGRLASRSPRSPCLFFPVQSAARAYYG
jgi:hypothetical protein